MKDINKDWPLWVSYNFWGEYQISVALSQYEQVFLKLEPRLQLHKIKIKIVETKIREQQWILAVEMLQNSRVKPENLKQEFDWNLAISWT